jgi:hypothetical protein
MDVVDVGPHAGVDVADQGAVVPVIPQGANGRGKSAASRSADRLTAFPSYRSSSSQRHLRSAQCSNPRVLD